MILLTDHELIKGICELYPESKEERDTIFALYEAMNKKDPNSAQISGEGDAIFLTIYRTELSEKHKNMKTAEKILHEHTYFDNTFERISLPEAVKAMKEYAEYYSKFVSEPHDCHGKGYEVKGNVIYCRECNEPLFEIIGYKNQKHL